MAEIHLTPREAAYNLVEMYRSVLISQDRNTADERSKLIATDQPIQTFAARILEVYADIDVWVEWAEKHG